MIYRRLTSCAIGVLAATVTACASNVSGHGSDGGSPGGSNTAGSQSGPGSTATQLGPNTTPAQLQAALSAAARKIRSAHFALTASVAGQSISGSGDEKTSNGKLQALQLNESLPAGAGDLGLVVIGTKAWVKLPTALRHSSKPWLAITSDSSNPTIRQLASSLGSTLSSASVVNADQLSKAATSVQVLGKQTVNGMSVTHVHLVVDPTKMTSTLPGGSSALSGAGVTSIPIDLYLDDQDRPVLTTTTVPLQGQHVQTKVTISRYDQSVSIEPPPASEVAPG